jgi:hypothetical protein
MVPNARVYRQQLRHFTACQPRSGVMLTPIEPGRVVERT